MVAGHYGAGARAGLALTFLMADYIIVLVTYFIGLAGMNKNSEYSEH